MLLGTTANRCFASSVSFLLVVLLDRTRSTEQRVRSMIVAMAAVSRLLRKEDGLSLLQAVEFADVIGPGQWALECFDDDHAAAAAWTRRWFVIG